MLFKKKKKAADYDEMDDLEFENSDHTRDDQGMDLTDEPGTQSETAAETEAKSEAETEDKAESEAETETETAAETEAEAEAETETEAEAEIEAETGDKLNEEVAGMSEGNIETDSEVQSEETAETLTESPSQEWSDDGSQEAAAQSEDEDADVASILAASDEFNPEERELQRELKRAARLDKLKAWQSKRKKKKQKKEQQKPEDINIVKELLNLIIYIGIVIILCYVIITFVGQQTKVNGHSMEPTLQSGDTLWIDKISYTFSKPKRFDIIVFPYQESDVYYIKRIIGLPGETVQIDINGNIYIDGEILDENYGLETISPNMINNASTPITLGDDEYFVLGDNRNNSRDSRWADVGNVKGEDIIGKAVFRLTPFSNFGFLN